MLPLKSEGKGIFYLYETKRQFVSLKYLWLESKRRERTIGLLPTSKGPNVHIIGILGNRHFEVGSSPRIFHERKSWGMGGRVLYVAC